MNNLPGWDNVCLELFPDSNPESYKIIQISILNCVWFWIIDFSNKIQKNDA